MLNDQEESYIQHEQQMDEKSCRIHNIEVKKCKLLSKPESALTSI